MEDLLNNYSTEIAAMLGAGVFWLMTKLWDFLKSMAAKSSNKIDDALIAKIEELVANAVAAKKK